MVSGRWVGGSVVGGSVVGSFNKTRFLKPGVSFCINFTPFCNTLVKT